MIDALFSGISALNAFQNGLNSESNNLANTNTIGYKADKISFADMMYQQGIGQGVKTQDIVKDFKQGTIKVTGNNLDVAIDGKGFFILRGDTKESFYSRAGNFRVAEDGTIQTPEGYKLQGVVLNKSKDIVSSDTNIDKITDDYTKTIVSKILKNGNIVSTFNALSTNYINSATDDGDILSGNGKKSRESKINDISYIKKGLMDAINEYIDNPVDGSGATTQKITANIPLNAFNSTFDEISYTIDNENISQAYKDDSLTTLKLFADKLSKHKGVVATVDSGGNLTIKNLLPGNNYIADDIIKIEGPNNNQSISVTKEEGSSGDGYQKILSIEKYLKEAIEKANGKYLRIANSLDTSSKQLNDIQVMLDNLNISTNPFGDIEINDGIVYSKQGDNRFVLAKISTALFKDQLGLDPQGDNIFSKTKASGEPILATNENKLIGKAIELSNSNAGDSLVNLMVYQRAFEASSKSITTSDDFLKTAIQLKR